MQQQQKKKNKSSKHNFFSFCHEMWSAYVFVWDATGQDFHPRLLFDTKAAQCLVVKWALLKLGVVDGSGVPADFMSSERLWLHRTVCDGSGTEVRADCQCRCPEGRVDVLLHAGSTDGSPKETELPTMPWFRYLTLQCKKRKFSWMH